MERQCGWIAGHIFSKFQYASLVACLFHQCHHSGNLEAVIFIRPYSGGHAQPHFLLLVDTADWQFCCQIVGEDRYSEVRSHNVTLTDEWLMGEETKI